MKLLALIWLLRFPISLDVSLKDGVGVVLVLVQGAIDSRRQVIHMVLQRKRKIYLLAAAGILLMFAATTASTSESRKELGQSASHQPWGVIESQSMANAPAAKQESVERIPVIVDPNSPANCALVTNGEMCSECCIEGFSEGSENWKACHNACAKADTARNEH